MRNGITRSGLQYAVRRSGSAVAYCALSIRCGTRDEAGFPCGIAHFTEHTLFRGTWRKSAGVISGYLDRLGGELNAYTTKEEIVLHATVLKEDLPKAARLLFELATEPSFPLREIETERGVVLDEIISYKDNPVEDAYDRFEGLLFAGHPLENPILGTARTVRKITPEDLFAFTGRFFVPERMAFTVVADLDEKLLEKRVLRLVDSLFPASSAEGAPSSANNCVDAPEGVPSSAPASAQQGNGRSEGNALSGAFSAEERVFPGDKAIAQGSGHSEGNALSGAFSVEERVIPGDKAIAQGSGHSEGKAVPFQKTIDKHHHEVNAVIGGTAPSLYSEKERIVTAVLANLLGGPASNSLLNRELRERRGWVYGVECNYTQYADTGIIAISFGCDRPNLERCLAAVDRILARLREVPLSPRQMAATRKQLLAQLAVSSDNGEAQCLSMGKSLLSWGRIASPEEIRAQVEAVTAEDLLQAARTLFAPERLSRLLYL